MDGLIAKFLRSAVLIGFLVVLPAYALMDHWPAGWQKVVNQWVPGLVDEKEEPRLANRLAAPEALRVEADPHDHAPRHAALTPQEEVAASSDEIRPLTVPSDEESPLKAAEIRASGAGRNLRAPVYRPLAENEAQPMISRIPVAPPVAAPPVSQQADAAMRTHVESRLQELGAHYYRLDADAGTGGYRFFCEFPAADGPSGLRRFEAVDADEATAMHRVLADAEAWRQSRYR